MNRGLWTAAGSDRETEFQQAITRTSSAGIPFRGEGTSASGLRQIETWRVLSWPNGLRSQSSYRSTSASPAIRAIRSSSDGHT